MLYRFVLNVHRHIWSNSLGCRFGNEKHLATSANYLPSKEEIISLTKRYIRRSVKLPCPVPKQKSQEAGTVIINETENDDTEKQEMYDIQKAKEDVQAMSDQNQKTDSSRNLLVFQQNKEKIQEDIQKFQRPINVEISKPSCMKKEKFDSSVEEDKKEEKDDEDLEPIIVTRQQKSFSSKLIDRKEFINDLNDFGAKKLKESKASPKYKFVFEIKTTKNSNSGQDIKLEIKASESLKKLQNNSKNVEDVDTFELETPEREPQQFTASPTLDLNAGSVSQQMKPLSEYPNTSQRTIKPLQIATYNSIKHHEELIKLHYQQLQAQKQNLRQADELVREHSRLKKLGKKR